MQFGHPFIGSEFDWLAADADGFVAVLSTAGTGPLPISVLENAALFENLDLFESAMKLVESCDAVANEEVPGVTYHWVKLARRGLFAYDWSEEKQCYEIVAAPRVPRRADSLGTSEFANLARMTMLPLKFGESRRIESTVVA